MTKPGEKLKRNGTLKIMIAGHGGQGVLDLGNYIAHQALKDGDHVVYTPTYGPESRGGKVRCWVTLSSNEIDSPIAEVLDILMVLNKPSMDFVAQLRPGGTIFYNISIIDREIERRDITAIQVPCSDLAADLVNDLDRASAKVDSSKALNCIMYGSFLCYAGWGMHDALVETEDTFKSLYQGGKAGFIPLNMAGVKRGFEFLIKERKHR